MKEILEYVKSNQAVISGISSITSVILVFFTLIFTIIYVNATIKLVHIPYKSYVKVKRIDEKMNLIITNLGPGIAFNIIVYYYASKTLARITNSKKRYFWNEYQTSDALSEMDEKKDAFLSCLRNPILGKLFLIKWSTQTGKTYKKHYKYVSWTHMFREATHIELIRHRGYRFIECIKITFVYFKVKSYMEENYIIALIIDMLNKKGELTIDLIADEIGSRNDEQIEKIIEKMVRKDLLVMTGFDITLTEKGTCYHLKEDYTYKENNENNEFR